MLFTIHFFSTTPNILAPIKEKILFIFPIKNKKIETESGTNFLETTPFPAPKTKKRRILTLKKTLREE